MRVVVFAALVLVASASHGALLGRAPATQGGTDYQAYFDDTLGITWLADANRAATETFGSFNIDADGSMSWHTASNWILNMNAAKYLGITSWRLSKTTPADGSAFAYGLSYDGSTDLGYNLSAPDSRFPGATGSELANLHYATLGNPGAFDVTGDWIGCGAEVPQFCMESSGPFANIQASLWYWSETVYVGPYPDPQHDNYNVWSFAPQTGLQTSRYAFDHGYAWAVTDGDPLISAIPIPGAAWLLGPAVVAMGWMRRRTNLA